MDVHPRKSQSSMNAWELWSSRLLDMEQLEPRRPLPAKAGSGKRTKARASSGNDAWGLR